MDAVITVHHFAKQLLISSIQ